MTDNFVTSARFFDDKHYPRGFSRHGDFTIKEAQLLERLGQAFNSLDIGIRQPLTDDEHRFVEVCRGLRKPETEAEQVWTKYMTKIKRPKRIHTLSGGKPNVEGGMEDYSDI